MPGESQQLPTTGHADPSVLTTQQMLQKVDDSEAEIDAKFAAVKARLDGIDKATELLHDDFTRFPTEVQKEVGHLKELFEIRMQAEKEIGLIREAYRLELKADSKETLATAMTAAEKAVQTALAAAEKARDQQTIASQLATDKAEMKFGEALGQITETFKVAIASLVDGVNEVKSGLAELRTERRNTAENTTAGQARSSNAGLWVGLGIAAVFGLLGFLASLANLFAR